jgi:hypothetical protein
MGAMSALCVTAEPFVHFGQNRTFDYGKKWTSI